MRHENAFIPYGGYWSTPFCKWQGSFADLHPIKFAAEVTKSALAERNIEAGAFDSLYFGLTVPSRSSFYGTPWLAGLIGAEGITGKGQSSGGLFDIISPIGPCENPAYFSYTQGGSHDNFHVWGFKKEK